MNRVLLVAFLFALINFVQANALVYDNGIEPKPHNCMTAVPYGYQKYNYVPCDTSPSSIQNFNLQKSQTTSNHSLQNRQDGFVERENPNTMQGQIASPPIVTHTEVQHAIMHEETGEMSTISQSGLIIQPSEVPNYTNWYIIGVVTAVSFVFILVRLLRRENRRSYVSSVGGYGNTGTIRTYENGNAVDTTIQEVREIQNWNSELWTDVKTNFPRDWEKILKWISENPEDVKIILKASKDHREALRQMAKEAVKQMDWEDLK
jgi:hypothetical protein